MSWIHESGGRLQHKVVQVPAASLRPLESPEAYEAVPRRVRTLDGQIREVQRQHRRGRPRPQTTGCRREIPRPTWPGVIPLRRFPKARGELEARLPAWRDAAKAIGGLGAALDDAECVGGVLWTGLTHRGPRETRTSRGASSWTG